MDEKPSRVSAGPSLEQAHRLGAQEGAGKPGQRTERAGLGSGRRRALEQAAEAARDPWDHGQELHGEVQQAAVRQRLSRRDGGIVGEKHGGEVARRIDHDVRRANELACAPHVEAARENLDLEFGKEPRQTSGCCRSSGNPEGKGGDQFA